MLALLVLSFSFYLSVFAGPVSQRAPWQPILYGCQNSIISSDNPYRLTSSTTYSQYWECKYTFQEFDGTTSVAYCWYDYQNHTIYRWPNTPLPGTYSDENCPTVVGKASKYLIKTSSTGKCVTKMGNYDGAPVQIQDCDYRHGNPSQVWFFDGSTIKQGNKCLDVKDGVKFYHWVRNDGKLMNGTPIQMWGCYYPNPNQVRRLHTSLLFGQNLWNVSGGHVFNDWTFLLLRCAAVNAIMNLMIFTVKQVTA